MLPPMSRAIASALLLLCSLAMPAVAAPNVPSIAQIAAQATPASQGAVDPRRQGETVQRAYNLLLDRFVHPLSSADLLRAGWAGIEKDARARNLPPPSQAPALTGDRAADLDAFRTAFETYLTRQPLPADFVASYSAVRSMVQLANERHTYFLNPRDYESHLAWSRGDVRYSGIGAQLKGSPLTVTDVFVNSPAAAAGLRKGDVILAINGRSTDGNPLEQLVEAVRGPEGSTVELTIQRAGEPAPRPLRITRGQVSIDFVTHRLLSNNVGYVSLRGFSDQAAVDEIERDVVDLQAAGAEALVLDLRGNSGGRIDVGTRLLSHFLPGGTNIFQEIDRSGRTRTRASDAGDLYNLPLVVLVDEGSASMAEIFAAAVQESGAGTIVGRQTSGNVAAAAIYPLGDGSALQVTILEILSPSGKALNSVGVTPDEVVPASRDVVRNDGAADPVLDRAVALLSAELQGRAQPSGLVAS